MSAFRATYSNFVNVKTRGVVQIVLEVPLHESNAALEVLGGMPDPAKERWFGVAPLSPNHAQPQPVEDKRPAGAKREKRDWRDMQPSAQAAIRCDEAVFRKFLEETYSEDWQALERDPAEVVRFLCGVKSRSELNTNHASRVIWHQLDSEFQAWKMVEHA